MVLVNVVVPDKYFPCVVESSATSLCSPAAVELREIRALVDVCALVDFVADV